MLIEKGFEALMEKRLKKLEEVIGVASKTGKDVHEEVDSYLEAERIAGKENINIEEYAQRYHQLSDKFWKEKLREEQRIVKEAIKK